MMDLGWGWVEIVVVKSGQIYDMKKKKSQQDLIIDLMWDDGRRE